QGPQFVPADAPIYIEARLDMPDGQGEALAQLLTAFPGFADAASFDMKMDELIGGLGGEMGMEVPAGDIFGDVLTGEIGIAIGDLEAAVMGAEDPAVIVGMAIADAEMAEPIAAAFAGGAGLEGDVSEEMYGDTAIISDYSTSVAIHGEWMLLSNDIEQVKVAIDVLDGNVESLADDADFATAFARVPTGHLGAAYVDLQSFGSFIDLANMMTAGQTGMELPMDDLAALLPVDMVMYLVAEADRMHLEVLVTPGEGTPALPVGESDLANLVPADTQLYVEVRELGATVETSLNELVEAMAAQEEMLPVDESMGALGAMSDLDALFGEDSPVTMMLGVPLPEFLDFVVDTSVGAGMSSDGLWLGIAGEVSDQAVAEDRVGNLISLIKLFGGDPAVTGVNVTTEMIGDVEVTNVSVPIDDMTAETGLPIDLGDSISVAVADDVLLIGLGDFVQAALSGDGTDSLGASAGYIDALADDTVNGGLMYVNISSLLAVLDPMLAMMAPEWADIAPYATGFDRMIAVGTADDAVIGARMTVIVNQ
ncbi:MAG: DUF3352 domain-containing protein, partial [Chloroflexota bacterium]|nr:DUF3352 domain-containing protein [Chloroflexota bacterium]